MSSFHFQIIALKNSHFEFLPSMSQFWPVFRRMTHNHLHTNPHIYKMQHIYKSWFALMLVPSNLPAVNQCIIDTSTSLEHDYQNNPYSIDATSNPHNLQKQLCNLPQLNKTASTINTLQVHAKGNKLNNNGHYHARYILETVRQFKLHAKSKPMLLSLNNLRTLKATH